VFELLRRNYLAERRRFSPGCSTPKADLISEQPFNTELLLNGWYWDLRHADDDLRQQWLNRGESRVKFQFNFSSHRTVPLSFEVPTFISGSGFVVGVAARSVPQRAGWFDS
jgi:hypothetical protein